MRNSALPFLSSALNMVAPEEKEKEKRKKEEQFLVNRIKSRDISLVDANKELKESSEKGRKRLEQQKEDAAKLKEDSRGRRTTEIIKAEGGVESARTRKLKEIDKDKAAKKAARQKLKNERDKKFGKDTELGEKNRESRREKRDNIKQGRKDIQKLNKEIRAKRANERKQAWIEKRVASGKFENAAQAEERFNALKDIRSKQAKTAADILGDMASKEQLGNSDDQQTLDIASQNNAADFKIQTENRIQLMDI